MFRIPVRYSPGDAIHLYHPARTWHANTRSTPHNRLSFPYAHVRIRALAYDKRHCYMNKAKKLQMLVHLQQFISEKNYYMDSTSIESNKNSNIKIEIFRYQ